MITISLSSQNYQKAVRLSLSVLKGEGLLLLPSDTVYILAVDATNQKAVQKLLSFKNRWTGKAISVAVSDPVMAASYVRFTPSAKTLYQNLLPGPFTLISPGKHRLASGIEAEDGTLGIRIPDHPFLLDLVKKFKKPITATSANLSGRHPHYSPTSFLSTLSQKKKDLLDLLVDGGKLPRNLPSTVIDTTQKELKILRRGDLLASSDQIFISHSPVQTQKIARFIFQKSQKKDSTQPLVFCLTGDLGAGKTVFTQGLGKLFNLPHLPSPTFNIVNEYQINHLSYRIFYHFDLYRLEKPYEFTEINFLSHFTFGSISSIEWSENLGPYFKKLQQLAKLVTVQFEYLSPQTRKISFQVL
jgi:L-threonylcarbamoyladenylate synthase